MEQFLEISTEPRYPKFADYEIRYLSYSNWNNTKNPHELAKSGFTFIGGKDNVQCFQCGVILNNWDRADDVDFCHKTSSPDCRFIKSKQAHIDKSSLESFSSVLAQLRNIKDILCEIKQLLNTDNLYYKDYKLF